MPRFQFSTPVTLDGLLKENGLRTLFDPARAKLPGITGDEALWVSHFDEEAFVSADEEGMQASAPTAVRPPVAATAPSTSLDIDRPFIVAVVDRASGEPLLFGRVVDPDPLIAVRRGGGGRCANSRAARRRSAGLDQPDGGRRAVRDRRCPIVASSTPSPGSIAARYSSSAHSGAPQVRPRREHVLDHRPRGRVVHVAEEIEVGGPQRPRLTNGVVGHVGGVLQPGRDLAALGGRVVVRRGSPRAAGAACRSAGSRCTHSDTASMAAPRSPVTDTRRSAQRPPGSRAERGQRQQLAEPGRHDQRRWPCAAPPRRRRSRARRRRCRRSTRPAGTEPARRSGAGPGGRDRRTGPGGWPRTSAPSRAGERADRHRIRASAGRYPAATRNTVDGPAPVVVR